VHAWMRLWQTELDTLVAAEKCAGAEACVKRAQAAHPFPGRELDQKVGAEAAKLLRHGTLGVGSLNLSFSFTGTGQLVPIVGLEPRFLAVEFPARFLAAAPPAAPAPPAPPPSSKPAVAGTPTPQATAPQAQSAPAATPKAGPRATPHEATLPKPTAAPR
jgi:hypothetical protein